MSGWVNYYDNPTIHNGAVEDMPCPMFLLNSYLNGRVGWGSDGVHQFVFEADADQTILGLQGSKEYPLHKCPSESVPWLW